MLLTWLQSATAAAGWSSGGTSVQCWPYQPAIEGQSFSTGIVAFLADGALVAVQKLLEDSLLAQAQELSVPTGW
jgi:hypothetical protein